MTATIRNGAGMVPRRFLIALIALCLAPDTPSLAANITVSGDSPREAIIVTIEDATIDVVLEDLHRRYGFEIDGLEYVRNGDALSATMSGSLQSVLERLLRNRNHMIVRSPDSESGIEKVMILDSTYGSAPSSAEQTGAKGETQSTLRQAFSGETARRETGAAVGSGRYSNPND